MFRLKSWSNKFHKSLCHELFNSTQKSHYRSSSCIMCNDTCITGTKRDKIWHRSLEREWEKTWSLHRLIKKNKWCLRSFAVKPFIVPVSTFVHIFLSNIQIKGRNISKSKWNLTKFWTDQVWHVIQLCCNGRICLKT